MVRKLIPALVLLAAHFPGNVLALGVGDIHLESALNQEFNAYIDLLSVKTDELDGVKIQLATPDAFERAGVDRPYMLSKLRFIPEIGPKGEAVIHVTSREPIREPFLNFLIEVNWAKGRLVREYTVLLDPPVTLERRPAPVAQPVTTAPAPMPSHSAAEMPAAVGTEPTTAAQTEYGPVQATDTLWNIAKSVKPQGTSVHQMMMALQRSNPHAFSKNNVNNLKRGAILRIPGREEISLLSEAEARAEFAAQVDDWRAGRPTVAAPVEKKVEAVVEEAPVEESASEAVVEEQVDARLELASARPDAEGAEGASEGEDAERTVSRLENSLILANEEVESARQENQELSDRLKALEDKLAEMERMQHLVTVRDEQLAALQAGAAEEAEPAAVPETKPAEEVVEEKPVQEPAVASAPEAAKPLPPIKQPKPDSTLDQLLSLVQERQTEAIAVGGGVLLLLLLLLLRRRKPEDEQTLGETMAAKPEAKKKAVAEEPVEEAEDQVGGETSFLSDFATSDVDSLQEDTGEADPLSEADVYIAYGRYQQAEELLKQAIDSEPERLPLKHKLLEIYHATNNSGAFTQLAEEMAAQGAEQADSVAWAKALSMGAAIASGHALFSGAVAAEAPSEEMGDLGSLEDELGDLEELAADLDLGTGEAPEADVAAEPESELDLDLDLDDALQDLDVTPESPAAEGEEDFGFDLDLDAAELAADEGGMALEAHEEADLEQSLSGLSADDLMPEQLEAEDLEQAASGLLGESSVEEEAHKPEDLAKELEDLAGDLDLGLGGEAESPDLEADLGLDLGDAGSEAGGLEDLGAGLELGEQEPGGLEGFGLEDADLGEGLDLGEETLGEEPGEPQDLMDSAEAEGLADELADLEGGLDLGLDAEETEDLEQTLSSLTEGLDLEADDAAGDLEQTLSSLTEGMDLGLGDEVDDLEESLSSLSGDLDLGEGADLEDLEETLSGFAEGLMSAEPELGEDEDLLADVSLDDLAGEESASTQLLEDIGGDSEGADEVSTKLDLARAYVEMGDTEGARSILEEVLSEGSDEQKQDAQTLLDQLS